MRFAQRTVRAAAVLSPISIAYSRLARQVVGRRVVAVASLPVGAIRTTARPRKTGGYCEPKLNTINYAACSIMKFK